MELTCDATTLSTALAPLRACLSTPLPTGEAGLVTIEALSADRIACRASTMDLEVMWALEATIARPGSASVPGLPLLAFTREAICGPLRLALEDHSLLLNTGAASLRLNTCVQSLSRLMAPESPALATLPAGALERLLHRTAFCAGRDESRPALTAVLLRIAGSQLTAVATDGTRLAEATAFFGEGGSSNGVYHPPTDLLLAPRSAQALTTTLRALAADTPVALHAHDGAAHVIGGSARWGARLLAGTYPPYESVFEPRAEHRLRATRSDLLQAIRQVSGLIGDQAIRLTLLDHAVTVTGVQDGDQARATITAHWDGPPTAVSCAPRALAEGLDVMDAEHVTLAIASSHAPIRCDAAESPGHRYVVMPVGDGYPPADPRPQY